MKVSRQVITKLVREQIRYGEDYSHAKLYGIYLQIMNQDRFVGYPVMSSAGFGRLVRTWASSEGWLDRKLSKDGKALFFKRDLRVKCPALRLIEWVKQWKL